MRSFYNWAYDEAVDQQQNRIMQLLTKIFPILLPPYKSPANQNLGTTLLQILKRLEATLENPEDIRKSATISQFLKTYKPNPQESIAHLVDRFERELKDFIYKSNTKNKTPEQMALIYQKELAQKLPNEPKEVIQQLLAQIQQGARVDDVVNTYLSKKKAVGSDKVIAREGTLEMIEVVTWNEDGSKEQHIDRAKGPQVCHPLFKGTKWCIRFKEYFDDYTSKGPLYLIRENGKPLILGHPESEWLDTEDEPPDPNLMKRLSVFIMNAGIGGLFLNTIIYLPKPVQMTEQYLATNPNSPWGKQLKEKAHKLLLGQDYKLNGETLVIMEFNWLSDALSELSGMGDNKIEIDFDELEQRLHDDASYNNAEVGDLVGWLSGRPEDEYIEYLEKRRVDGYYDKIDDWDELSLSDAVEAINREYKHDDAINLLYNASIDATTEETINKIHKQVFKELESGDELGFYVGSDWKLCIYADRVNMWLAENIVNGGYEYHKDNGMINHMNFVIENRDINFDFSSKIFNQRVSELIKEQP